MAMVTELVRMVTHRLELSPIKSWEPLITWSSEVTWQTKYFIPPFAEDMNTKLGRVVNYREKLQPLNSHDLNLVTWQIGKILFPLSKNLWPLNLAG